MNNSFLFKNISILILSILLSGCGIFVKTIIDGVDYVNDSEIFRRGRHGDLSNQEIAFAKTAWKYFENNINTSVGLVNSIDGEKIFRLSTISDYIIALVSAHKLEIIDDKEFNQKASLLFSFLNRIKLNDNNLPYQIYDSQNGTPIEKVNVSILYVYDISRLLTWLYFFKSIYPNYSQFIDKSVLRIGFCKIIDECGVIYNNDGSNFWNPGYFSYTLKGFKIWGFDTSGIEKKIYFDKFVNVDSKKIFFEYPKTFETQNNNYFLSSTPYINDGLEFNWDTFNDKTSLDSINTDFKLFNIANEVYKVQEKRFYDKKIFTARSEYINENGDFNFDTIFSNGYPWNTLDSNNNYIPEKSIISTKTVFGLWALWKTDYTNNLLNLLMYSNDSRGWFEGKFESNGANLKITTAETNSKVLESLLYKKYGKISTIGKDNYTLYDYVNDNEFIKNPKLCHPKLKKKCDF